MLKDNLKEALLNDLLFEKKPNYQQGSPRLLLATGQMRSRVRRWQSQSTLEGSLGLCKPHTPENEFERWFFFHHLSNKDTCCVLPIMHRIRCACIIEKSSKNTEYIWADRLSFWRAKPDSCQQWTQQRVAPSRHLLQSSFQQPRHSPWREYFLPWKTKL